jgi:hypothetical protein
MFDEIPRWAVFRLISPGRFHGVSKADCGWHNHVGIVVVTVKDGAVTRYMSDCSSQTFHAGDVFIETGDMGPMRRCNGAERPEKTCV